MKPLADERRYNQKLDSWEQFSGENGDKIFRFPCSANHEFDWQPANFDTQSAASHHHALNMLGSSTRD